MMENFHLTWTINYASQHFPIFSNLFYQKSLHLNCEYYQQRIPTNYANGENQDMRKILIVCNRTLNLGGIETSLIQLVKALASNSQNVITLLIADTKGVLTDRLPSNIELIVNPYERASYEFHDDLKKLKIPKIIYGIFHRVKLRLTKLFYGKIKEWYKIAAPYFEVKGSYDLAIAYSTDYSDLAIVIEKVAAKKKIAFLHSDPTVNMKVAKINDRLLEQFDSIFCVSKGVQNLYSKVHHSSAAKTSVFHNIFDDKEIVEKAYLVEKPITNSNDGTLNILTVGRISAEKGQDRIPEIARKLADNNYAIRWYLVGDGSMTEKVKENVKHLELENIVFFLGNKPNPFPYIKNCDIYVQPSKSEAYCTVTMEAKILHKPIVTTDVPGMREQFESGKNGLIVESSVDGLYEGIKKLLDHPEIAQEFVKNLESEVLDNSGELEKLYRFIDS